VLKRRRAILAAVWPEEHNGRGTSDEVYFAS
jgi:hypothetical protein